MRIRPQLQKKIHSLQSRSSFQHKNGSRTKHHVKNFFRNNHDRKIRCGRKSEKKSQ